ncbi:MAG TPA: response regulator transcription factor [Chloroflexota bacterium]|nr:response regulator transcription factor [Chloroflexota bacterium]
MPEADVLLVEDEPSLRLVTRLACESAGFSVREAPTGAEALAQFRAARPDVVLLDLMLPDMDGYDVCRQLRRLDETLPVIMVTARGEEVDKVIGLELGADDYLTKPYGTRELVARIRTQLRKARLTAPPPSTPLSAPTAASTPTSANVIRAGPIDVSLAAREVRVGGRSVTLTRTEFDILAFLAQHAGAALTREQIITAVWGYDAAETLDGDRLVDSHVKNLRRKLGADGAPRIQTLPRVGYKLTA